MVFSPNPDLVETVERLQNCLSSSRGKAKRHWLDVLGLKEGEYREVLRRRRALPESSLLALSDHLSLSPEELFNGSVDFHSISAEWGAGSKTLPEAYSVAAFGRRRTTITSFDFIEQTMGWRMRSSTLDHFDLNEALLSDYTATINMQFMTDVADYLHRRYRVGAENFFRMGVHSVVGNRQNLIGELLSCSRDTMEAYERMLIELVKFFEQNTKYSIVRLDRQSCVVEVISYKHVAEALGKRHLGNRHICMLKAGILASIPAYLDLPLSKISEPLCVHRGDDVCRYEIEFPQAKRPS